MTFGSMRRRLLMIVRERVGNGEITESHLARLVGISQSHIHNVLKGVRKLSPELADEILTQLRMNAGDLLLKDSSVCALPFRSVPLLSGLLGTAMRNFEPERTIGSAQVPASLSALLGRPLAARLGQDSRASPRFESGDLVLIDRSLGACRKIIDDAVYVVMTIEGPRLRYVRSGSGRLYLASEESMWQPSKWEPELRSSIRGRIVWVSRRFEVGLLG